MSDRGEHFIGFYVPNHGWYEATPEGLDYLIAKYLPASLESLRKKLQSLARTSGYEYDYTDIRSVTECLLVIGQITMEGYRGWDTQTDKPIPK